MIMGGRFMCFGELTTMWRESGNIIERFCLLFFGMFLLNLGECVVYEIII